MAKWSSQGTVVAVELVPGSGTYSPIINLTSVNFPEINPQYENTTDLANTSGFMEYSPTMTDTSETTMDGIWDPTDATHDALLDEAIKPANQKTLLNFRITMADTGAARDQFGSYVSLGRTAQANSTVKFQLKLRVSGGLTYTQ